MRASAKKATMAGMFAIALVAALLWLILRAVDWGLCSWYGTQTERETRFAAFVGCMVKTSSGWVPRSELRTQQ
ncbi:hypothetical protein G7009_01575 [Pseudomonas capeferrum]|uniref:hypothetical protein n=1 Tax=Pseudomonas capeferrum TaxID=1495066 RepID=UPI0015E2DF1D|nr:hypothetical protein [Pseudomonas capeferrum]MBA1200493.1 hypothetical protein [Pseudomonas capeferrum]